MYCNAWYLNLLAYSSREIREKAPFRAGEWLKKIVVLRLYLKVSKENQRERDRERHTEREREKTN